MLRVARMSTSTPSRATTSSFPLPAPLWPRAVLCLTIAALLGLGLGVWQASAEHLLLRVHPLLLALGGAGFVGLLAGQTTDIILRKRSRALCFLVALIMLLVWMGVGDLSARLFGAVSLHVMASAGYWLEFGQVLIGGLGIAVALLVCQAARRPPTPPAEELVWVWQAGQRTPRPWRASLLRRGLVPGLILAALVGLGLGYASVLPVPVPALATALAGAGLLGLLAGAWCRRMLRGRAGAARFGIAMAILTAGVLVSQGMYAMLRVQNPLLGYEPSEAFWTALGQLAVGGLCIVVVSLFWQPEPPRRLPRAPMLEPAPEPPIVAPPQPVPEPRGPRFRLPLVRLPARSRTRSRIKARVIATEEDRCPYCLDTVARDDPRGMVVCSVCGTPHHADCWQAAGAKCQVPHLNV
ncbi:MAG: hypothetical protein KKA73_28650 [Chloroflexi bacterium]|nr:hypothetical protein [Chloroflexota bacterium]MBU1751664.1 hypothetical protein [Chloroflexota bacterium]